MLWWIFKPWWMIAAFCAFFVKGLCGFANTLVFTTILSFGNHNINISPVELVLGYPTNFIMALKERKSIQGKICIPLSAMVLLGSLLGVIFLKNAETTFIKIVFGFVIILIGAEMLIRELFPKKLKQHRMGLVVIGLLSGLLCGLYGIGALLGAYVGRITEDTRSFKANLCVVFIVENTFRLILYSVFGIITIDIIKRALALFPFMLAGLGLGMLSGRVLDEKLVKKLVIVMLMLSGAVLIGNNV